MENFNEMIHAIDFKKYVLESGSFSTDKEGDNLWLNPCPVCGHEDHFSINGSEGIFNSLSGCCEGGSLYDYFMQVEGLDQKSAALKIRELANVKATTQRETPLKKSEANSADGSSSKVATIDKLTEDIITLHKSNLSREFFYERGISDDVIDKYKLSIGNPPLYNSYSARAILPVWEDSKCFYYTARNLDDSGAKYLVPSKNELEPMRFNEHLLKGKTEQSVVFIVEGTIDALVFESITGFEAVGLHGVNFPSELKSSMPQMKDIRFVLMLDNDDAGLNAMDSLQAFADARLLVPEEFGDPANWGKNDPEGMLKAVNELIEAGIEKIASPALTVIEETPEKSNVAANTSPKPPAEGFVPRTANVASYLASSFYKQLDKVRTEAPRSTGLACLDEILGGGLYQGLHVLGAETSIGKSALAMFISNHVASQGRPVIYFSLEISILRMTLRALSLTSFMNRTEITPFEYASVFMSHAGLDSVRKAGEIASEGALQHLHIIDNEIDFEVDHIRMTVEEIMKQYNESPLVVVDYLQIIRGNDQHSEIRNIDRAVRELRSLSEELMCPVLAISSFNRRTSKNALAAQDRYKGSGSIEFTADSSILLEPWCYTDENGKWNEVTGKLKDVGSYRKLRVKVEKNRMGMKEASGILKYYPAFNSFESVSLDDSN